MDKNTDLYGDITFQKFLIEQLLLEKDSYARVKNILKPEYFDSKLQRVVKFVDEYTEEQHAMPSLDLLRAMTSVNIDLSNERVSSDFILKTTEDFCRFRALESAVIEGSEYITNGRGADLEKRIKDALTISLISDLGTNYFDDPRERLMRVKDKSNIVTTTYRTLDKMFNGGVAKGSLSIWCAKSGGGKSLALQNLGLNYSLLGLNVVYITLELSEDLVNQRIDAMATGIEAYKVLHDIDETAMRVATVKRKANGGRGAGLYMVKKMSEAGTTANDIKAYLKEIQIKFGIKPDVLLVDYLDLMYPNNAKLDISNLFTKDKYVCEELRAVANEWDLVSFSAAQLNRGSHDTDEFDHSHIAGGISKINTADNVFALHTSIAMKEKGIYDVSILKARSASCVGQRTTLGFDKGSLRIFDIPDDEIEEQQTIAQMTIQSVMSDLKFPTGSPF